MAARHPPPPGNTLPIVVRRALALREKGCDKAAMRGEDRDPIWRAGWRIAGRAVWLGVVLAGCLPAHGLWRLVRKRSPWPRMFLRAAARACGAQVEMVGEPQRDNVFYVANHLSWIDIPILGGLVKTSFVAQDAIAGWPIIGWLAWLNDTIFVSRTERRTAGEQVDRLRAAIVRVQPVTLFPEGTTTDGRSLLPFKAPLFEGLVPPPPGMVVQPVLLDFDDAGKALAWIGTEGAVENARRTLGRRGSFDVRVRFLDPFDPADYPNRKLLTATVRARLAAALSEALGGVPVE